MIESGKLEELTVILMLKEVTANAGQKMGRLINLASDINYHPKSCQEMKPEK